MPLAAALAACGALGRRAESQQVAVSQRDGHSPTDCRAGPGNATCGGFKGCNTVGITCHTGVRR